MGVAIKNIHENKLGDKISTIKIDSPSIPHRYNTKVYLEKYIDAIGRVLSYCEKNGVAPAYVLSSSIEIGFRDYSFGFSKILDFYINKKALPLYCIFDSSVFDVNESQEIPGVRIFSGINEKKKKQIWINI